MMISRASISALTRALRPTVKLPSAICIFPSSTPSQKRSPRPLISPLIRIPLLTLSDALADIAPTPGTWSVEELRAGGRSAEDCGWFDSSLRHIWTPLEFELRSRGAGMPPDWGEAVEDDSTRESPCKAERPRIGVNFAE